MFDAVRNNKRIVQVFLGLIALPFAFFGVESYMNGSGQEGVVAEIGPIRVTQQQVQQALREQQDKLRASLGGQFDPALLNSPQIRKAVLDDLVHQRLLFVESTQHNLMVTDEALRRAVLGIEAFQVDGQFSRERYESLLRAQGMTPAGFEAQLRQDLMLQQLVGGLSGSAVVSKAASDRLLALQTEIRQVAEYRVLADAFMAKATVTPEAIQAYYDQNLTAFDTPEEVQVAYLVLSQDTLAARIQPTDEEIKAAYEANRKRYEQAEERRASHILVTPEGGDRAAAKAKAEEILASLNKAPDQFAALARKHSRDPGSAAKGGDLGFFGRGMMVKPFEEATFALSEGGLSGVVESDFGFHVIKLTAIRPASVKPLAEVRAEVLAEVKKSQAARRYAEAAEQFTNLVYEQSDTLDEAAKQLQLTVQKTDWIRRAGQGGNPLLNHPKVQAAIFSEDAIKHQRNTEALEIAPNVLLAARVLAHKPSVRQELVAVKAVIEAKLKREEALKLAKKEGESLLAAAQAGQDTVSWGAIKPMTRMGASTLPAVTVNTVFRMSGDTFPSYAGAELPGSGYVLYKMVAREPGKPLSADQQTAMRGQLGQMLAQESLQQYLQALRKRHKVVVHESVLNAMESR